MIFSHLMYADDLAIIANSSEQDFRTPRDILNEHRKGNRTKDKELIFKSHNCSPMNQGHPLATVTDARRILRFVIKEDDFRVSYYQAKDQTGRALFLYFRICKANLTNGNNLCFLVPPFK